MELPKRQDSPVRRRLRQQHENPYAARIQTRFVSRTESDPPLTLNPAPELSLDFAQRLATLTHPYQLDQDTIELQNRSSDNDIEPTNSILVASQLHSDIINNNNNISLSYLQSSDEEQPQPSSGEMKASTSKSSGQLPQLKVVVEEQMDAQYNPPPRPMGEITLIKASPPSFLQRLLRLRFPFTALNFMFWVSLGLITLGSFLFAYLIWSDLDVWGVKVWEWSLYFLILTCSVISLATLSGGLLYLCAKAWGNQKFYFYGAGIQYSCMCSILGILALVMARYWLKPNLDETPYDYLNKACISVVVVSTIHIARRFCERMLILTISKNHYFERLANAMFEEKILYKLVLLALSKEKQHLKSSLNSNPSGIRVKSKFKPLRWKRLHQIQTGIADEASTLKKLNRYAKYTRPEFLDNPSGYQTDITDWTNSDILLTAEMAEFQRKKEMQDMARLICVCLDKQGKGYVLMSDFEELYPKNRYRLQQAYLVFSAKFVESITLDDIYTSIKRIYNQREFIARGLADRADVAAVLIDFVGLFFWVIMFIIVLIIFNVNFSKVVIPYIFLFLSFSFAFGGTLKNMLDAAILILVVRPFDIGDKIQYNESGISYYIDRITLFRTDVFNSDLRFYQIPNSALVTTSILNLTRSQSYTLMFQVEMLFSTPSSTVNTLIADVHKHCANHEYLEPNPLIYIDSLTQSNSLTLAFWIDTHGLPWCLAGRWLMARTDFLDFWRNLCLANGVTYHLPLQTIRRERPFYEPYV